MDAAEQQAIIDWVANHAPAFLAATAYGRVDDAPLSTAVRLRWFNVTIAGKQYATVGLNIHYGGAFGALWVKQAAPPGETMEFHPHAIPRHNLPATLVAALRAAIAAGPDTSKRALAAKLLPTPAPAAAPAPGGTP